MTEQHADECDWDCPACRATLFQVAPVEGATADLVPLSPVKTSNLYETTPEPQDTPEHEILVQTSPYDDFPGGRWRVTCICGWEAFGRYAQDNGQDVANTLATMKGQEHIADPDRRCAYCGHPHREGQCRFCSYDLRHGHG